MGEREIEQVWEYGSMGVWEYGSDCGLIKKIIKFAGSFIGGAWY
jgi:hypothetical protein